MKVVFFGSDDFAAEGLKALLSSRHKVAACVTQPDRAKGRHLKLSPSLIKEIAVKSKIEILQPKNLRDKEIADQLKSFQADLFVVIAYGNILPPGILSIPKMFSINVHGSLLPKYRGAAPINWVIINGEKKSGISIIKMNEKMDAGDIIAQKEIIIEPDETSASLRERMAKIGAGLLLEAVDSIEKKSYQLTKQDEKKVSFAPKLKKEDGHVNWHDQAVLIHNRVRGLLPWPGAFSFLAGKQLKILKAKIVEGNKGKYNPGDVIEIRPEGFVVAAADRPVLILEVHLESSKPMNAKDFILGHKLAVGSKLE